MIPRANHIMLLLFTIILQNQSKWNLVILIINMDFNLGLRMLSPGRLRDVRSNAFSLLLGSGMNNTNKEKDLSHGQVFEVYSS